MMIKADTAAPSHIDRIGVPMKTSVMLLACAALLLQPLMAERSSADQRTRSSEEVRNFCRVVAEDARAISGSRARGSGWVSCSDSTHISLDVCLEQWVTATGDKRDRGCTEKNRIDTYIQAKRTAGCNNQVTDRFRTVTRAVIARPGNTPLISVQQGNWRSIACHN